MLGGERRGATLRHDSFMARTFEWRLRAVAALRLEEGQTVLDVGCGSGDDFELIEAQIGSRGHLIGIEPSAALLDAARARVERRGWPNVTLIGASAEEATPPRPADAALFSFAPETLRSPRAVAAVISRLRPGARLAAVGVRRAGRWNLPVNLAVRLVARPQLLPGPGADPPWRELEPYADLEVATHALGAVYLASGSLSEAEYRSL